jgi:hypothetical protein
VPISSGEPAAAASARAVSLAQVTVPHSLPPQLTARMCTLFMGLRHSLGCTVPSVAGPAQAATGASNNAKGTNRLIIRYALYREFPNAR